MVTALLWLIGALRLSKQEPKVKLWIHPTDTNYTIKPIGILLLTIQVDGYKMTVINTVPPVTLIA